MGLSHSPRIVTDGLVFCVDAASPRSYPGAGTTWTDLSKNRNNGTLQNGIAFSTDKAGIFTFDGTNEHVTFSDDISISEATFLVWLKRIGDQSNYAGVLFSRYGEGGTTGLNFTTLSNVIGYHWNNALNTYTWNDSTVTVPADEWCMIALTVTSSLATIYLHKFTGLSVATNSVTHNTTNLNNIHIGIDPKFSGSRRFNGHLAIGQIYNRALSAEEIKQNYNATRGRFQ